MLWSNVFSGVDNAVLWPLALGVQNQTLNEEHLRPTFHSHILRPVTMEPPVL